MTEKYLSLSLYVYVANNPLRALDPDGDGIMDIIAGIGDGFTRSTTPCQGKNLSTYPGDKHDFAVGRVIGDIAGMFGGLDEMVVGGGGVAGGGALSVTGEGAVVGVPAAVASAGLVAVGAGTTAMGTKNLFNDLNYLNQS